MKGITKRQRDILSYIENFTENNRYSPSFNEIKTHFGFASLNAVTKHLEALKRKGLLNSEPKCSRSIALTEQHIQKCIRAEIELPYIGTITAGFPIETFPSAQAIAVPEFMVHSPEKTYVLKVKGDTLQEELISDGDFLLVEARDSPLDGEMVVALINQHDTIIKKYTFEGPFVRLTGVNPQHQPMMLREEDIIIQGILVGMLRLYTN